MSNIIPTPAEARELHELFPMNHAAVNEAEKALRSWPIRTAEQAAEQLPSWERADRLSEREQRAVIARFICVETVIEPGAIPQHVGICGEPVAVEVSRFTIVDGEREGGARRMCVSCADRARGRARGRRQHRDAAAHRDLGGAVMSARRGRALAVALEIAINVATLVAVLGTVAEATR
jgi:hypothetical protein